MKCKLSLLMIVAGLFLLAVNTRSVVADIIEVTVQPGQTWPETGPLVLAPEFRVWDPNFWIHFQTTAHVHIRQHLRAWGHWTKTELEWAHFHAEYILPGPDSRVEIENIGTDPVQFDSVMNTTCLSGINASQPCMTDTDCPGSVCSPAVCRNGGNDGNPCPNGNVDCPGGTCDVNAVSLAAGQIVTTPMVGPLDASLPPGCPTCLPRIVDFWHWDWERSVTAAWLELRYWSVTDFHFAVDEWWHMSTDGIATGADGSFLGEYSIEITNNGTTPITFTCDSNMLFDPNVPAVSDWGVGAMVLLVLTAGTVVLSRRRAQINKGSMSA